MMLFEDKLGESKQNTTLRYEKQYRPPTAFCCREFICWGDRLNWKTKESRPLRKVGRRQSWRQLIKHIDQLAGLVSVRLIMLLMALPSSLSEEQWRFLLKMCAHGGRKHEKKKPFHMCVQHMHFFNHTRVCFKAQPTSSALPCSPTHSRDTSFSHRDLCRQTQLKAFTPLLI